uniref:Secreted protein n=1 Tax=Syphacia muris TaxID=451379 RepID=A0A0N5ABI0_9BILA
MANCKFVHSYFIGMFFLRVGTIYGVRQRQPSVLLLDFICSVCCWSLDMFTCEYRRLKQAIHTAAANASATATDNAATATATATTAAADADADAIL